MSNEGGLSRSRHQPRTDPVKAAFDIGTIVRWLDFNDTWLAAEWGHPSDNLGAILARCRLSKSSPTRIDFVRDMLTAMIKAHEVQGILALENSFNRVGLDHVCWCVSPVLRSQQNVRLRL